MPTEAQQWAMENNEELHNALDEAGASDMLHSLIAVQVDHRHSVVEEIWKWYDGDMDEAVETAERRGGGFFQKVWNGDYADAYLHADGNNQRIIEKAYSLDQIVDHAEGDYQANVVHERWTGALPA